MYTKPVPIEIQLGTLNATDTHKRHKRIYVSLNSVAFIFNQIISRYAVLETMLLDYDAFQKSSAPAPLSDRLVCMDITYPKRNNSVVGAAWDIIDWMERLRKVLSVSAGIKKNDDWYRAIMSDLPQVEEVRHFLQHFDCQIGKLVDGSYPLMGSVIARYPLENGSYTRILMSTPIRYADDNKILVRGFVVPIAMEGDVDCIVLSIAEKWINISLLMTSLRKAQKRFAQYLLDKYNCPWPD